MKGDKPSRLSYLHKRVIDQYFIPLKTDQVYMLGNSQEDLDLVSGDVVIATDRMSTYPVLGMRKFQKRFYFAHSYAFQCDDRNAVSSTVHYGGIELTSSVIVDNIAAFQFHPEKSQISGDILIQWFLDWQP